MDISHQMLLEIRLLKPSEGPLGLPATWEPLGVVLTPTYVGYATVLRVSITHYIYFKPMKLRNLEYTKHLQMLWA